MAKRNNLNILMNTAENNVMRKLNVAHICSVISLKENNKLATIQPLAQTDDGVERAVLIDVPVTKNCQELIGVGGIVVVLFMDRNSSNFNGSPETFKIKDERAHSVNDGVVIGVL
ncbi:MAG: hypothetical protein [Caudoviricetes sp.]|nr:MAG: hypothetical protein [Caudoviricetes sp.]